MVMYDLQKEGKKAKESEYGPVFIRIHTRKGFMDVKTFHVEKE